MSYPTLLSPFQVADVTLKNRIVMPPMVIWKSGEDAEVRDIHRKHYASSAGPGLMIVEATAVSPDGKLHKNQLGIFEDRHIQGLSRLAGTIRKTGALPGIQINHAGGRSTLEWNWGLPPLAPSTDGSIKPDSPECRTLTIDDIKRIQTDFVAAARRAVTAGFEYIELHYAHGYLGSQFLSPLTNTRTDEYGGSLENRQRFLIETYRACRDAVGDSTLLSCRLGIIDKDEDGLSLEEGIDTACRLEAEGAPILHISRAHGVPDSVRPEGSSFDPLLHLAGKARPKLKIPVIGIGGILTPAEAERAVNKGVTDLAAVGRGILADPQWALKVIKDAEDSIHICRRCNPCFWYKTPEKCPSRIAAGNMI
jgi:NADPH2 dehydrogenase